MSDFFYDAQTRRYLIQFMRIFADMKIRLGPDANGLYQIQQIPILYGDPSIMVSQLIQGASQNTLLPNPMMSAWIENIKIVPERRYAPQYVGKVSTIEREFNPVSQTYGEGPGIRQDIERYMPPPYDFYFRLDIWTSNTTTKLQILEQILMIFNPSLQLQQNSNQLDWTSIFECWLEDIVWTNRQIDSLQTGDADIRDVMSLKFKIQGFINPPAKLKRSGLIEEIVTNVFNVADVASIEQKVDGVYDPFSAVAGIPSQIITTLGNYKISVAKGATNDIITLLNAYGAPDPNITWANLFEQYGSVIPDITRIILKLNPDIENNSEDIIGTIAPDPAAPNLLYYTPDLDTLPGNTLLPITAIIDPTEVFPGNGLPVASAGQRYLLTSIDSVGEEPAIPPNVVGSPWGQFLVAYPNDIIEYNGSSWVVVFDSRNSTGKNYVVNNENGIQYTFDGKEWTYTYYGIYSPGYWIVSNLISCPCGSPTISNYE
jgi:hypothetical protein